MCLCDEMIRDALDKLRGAVTIVYPMNLPPYDPVRLEFEGNEDLSGTQVNSTYTLIVTHCLVGWPLRLGAQFLTRSFMPYKSGEVGSGGF